MYLVDRYTLFREMGVPTVRQSYSVVKRMTPDGERTDRLGVYLLTEVRSPSLRGLRLLCCCWLFSLFDD